jgi:hypothetical protein
MSWTEIGRLTIPRYRALLRAWSRIPPLPVLLAASLGLKPGSGGQDFTAFYTALTGKPPP